MLAGRRPSVPPADPAALADAIEQVLDDHVLAGRLGESARNWSTNTSAPGRHGGPAYPDLLSACWSADVRDSGNRIGRTSPTPRLVRRMCDMLAHRGPDGVGYHEDAHAALGMRRLAIIDVAGGQQPVYNEDRTVVAVFNGEIYNFRELERNCADGVTGSSRAETPNASSTCTRSTGTIWSTTCVACSPSPSGIEAAAPTAGPGPGGQEAACTGADGGSLILRLGTQGTGR